MLSIYDAASFFIDVANSREDDAMTNLKLNKLLYFAQGCHLARTGEPLFDECIDPVDHRPIIEGEELETLTDVMREFGNHRLDHFDMLTSHEALKAYFTEHPVPRFEPKGEIVTALPKDWYDPAEDEEWEKYLVG